MKNSEEIKQLTLKYLEKKMIESCINFNQTSNNFNFEFEIYDEYIFCLLTCDINTKSFKNMFRMLCVNIYEPEAILYKDGNVGCGFTIENVKTQTINHLMHNLNKIKLVLNK